MFFFEEPDYNKLLSYQELGEAGAIDVGSSMFDTFIYEDLSVSKTRNLDHEKMQDVIRAQRVAPELFLQGYEEPELLEGEGYAIDIINQTRKETYQAQTDRQLSDYEGIVEPNIEMLKKLDPEIRNINEIDQAIIDKAKALREKYEQTAARATPWDAFWGSLGGGVVGAMNDPLNVSTMFIGPGATSFAGGFLRGVSAAFGKSAAVGIGVESVIQPTVFDYKKEIESPYELRDALMNIAFAGIGEGILGGAGYSILRGFNKLSARGELTPAQQRVGDYIQQIQNIADNTDVYTARQLEAHVEALVRIDADLKEGRIPDFEQLNNRIEKIYLEDFGKEINGTQADIVELSAKRQELAQRFRSDVYELQSELKQKFEGRMRPDEVEDAQSLSGSAYIRNKPGISLDAVRGAQKADWEAGEAGTKLKAHDDAVQAHIAFKESRKVNGDQVKLKERIDKMDAQLQEKTKYLDAAKKARQEYIKTQSEKARLAIPDAPTDSPKQKAFKKVVNRMLANMGASNIKVNVYEGDMPQFSPNARFSVDNIPQEEKMLTVHNIELDSVLHAEKMGGLAAPSVAVINANRGFDNFGAITLVAHSDLVDPKASTKNRIFNADIYSPRYPDVEYKVSRKKFDEAVKPLEESAKKAGVNFYSTMNQNTVESDGLKAFSDNWVTMLHYLEISNKAPEAILNKQGDPDYFKIRNQVRNIISLNDDIASNFRKWVNESFADIIISEKVFAGYDKNGNRKYKPHTLDNVVKLMTKDLRGGENWRGIGQLRAFAAKEFKSISDIKSDRNKLINAEDMMSIKSDITYRVEELADELKPYYNYDADDARFNDTFVESLQDYAKNGKLNDFSNIPNKLLNDIDALINVLRDLPSEYFEAKLMRKVDFSEFEVALIPNEKIFDEAADILSRNGLQVMRHNNNLQKLNNLDSLDRLMFSKENGRIEAAIDPETGELHLNIDAFESDEQLMRVLREEVIGHYGLRQTLGSKFQTVISDIKSAAYHNKELRQTWIDLSGVDPRTKQVINENAPYAGMADDVIADEMISKLAREELSFSETTLAKLMSFITKALRAVGLVKNPITMSEMQALVVRSERQLKRGAVQNNTPIRVTGFDSRNDTAADQPLEEIVESEANATVKGEDDGSEIIDTQGNRVNYHESLKDSQRQLDAIDTLRICAL